MGVHVVNDLPQKLASRFFARVCAVGLLFKRPPPDVSAVKSRDPLSALKRDTAASPNSIDCSGTGTSVRGEADRSGRRIGHFGPMENSVDRGVGGD
jgi:hypothetical protein